MNQPELTQEKLAILEEIREIATIGELKLKEYMEESATIDEKWRLRAEAKRAEAQKQYEQV